MFLLNFKYSKHKHIFCSTIRAFKVLKLERSLTTAKTQAVNTDTHMPEQIQHKWYDLWQEKLKEFNKQARI